MWIKVEVIFGSEEVSDLEKLGIKVEDDYSDRGVVTINTDNIAYYHNEYGDGLSMIQFNHGGFLLYDGDFDQVMKEAIKLCH